MVEVPVGLSAEGPHMKELRLLVSPVRPQRRVLEPTTKDILPIMRGRFNNLIEMQQGSDGGDSVPVGLFMKSTQVKVKSCASPEVHEKVASGCSSPGASISFPSGCSPTGGESGARLRISVAKVEATEKSMREMRMKICTSPVRKNTRDGNGSAGTSSSSASGQPVMAPTAAVSTVSAALTQKRLHASAGSNPWAPTPSSSSGSGVGGGGGGRSTGRSRGQLSGPALSLSKSLNLSQQRSSSAAHAVVPHTMSVATTTRAMSRERARARSSHSERDGSGSGSGSGEDRSNGGGSGGTQGDIEMYRAAAHSRIAKALEKQRAAKALVVETESSRRQRGDNAGVKQKERHRYRAEIYAINTLLKKNEKERFSEFKKYRLESECEAAAQTLDNDDASIDSDDSGSIGDEPPPPSPGRSHTSMSPIRGGSSCSSGGAGLTVNTAPGSPHAGAVAPLGSPAPSPSKFGGV